MPRFPYPLKTKFMTVYGREYCPYCQKLKLFLKRFYGDRYEREVRYYDIDQIIEEQRAKDYDDFKYKMRPFFGNYSKIPAIFFYGEFLGGYDVFLDLMSKMAIETKSRKKIIDVLKNTRNLDINKRTEKIIKNLS